ncbi:hypothetical protein Peetri_00214 [Pseudomonas phage vB_PpuM-Peetri]
MPSQKERPAYSQPAKAFSVGFRLLGRPWWEPVNAKHRFATVNLPNAALTLYMTDTMGGTQLSVTTRLSRRTSKLEKKPKAAYINLGHFLDYQHASKAALGKLKQFLDNHPEHCVMPEVNTAAKLNITLDQMKSVLDAAGVKEHTADTLCRVFLPVPIKGDPDDGKSKLSIALAKLTDDIDAIYAMFDATFPIHFTAMDFFQADVAFQKLMRLINLKASDLESGGEEISKSIERLVVSMWRFKIDPAPHLLALGMDPDQSTVLATGKKLEDVYQGDPDFLKMDDQQEPSRSESFARYMRESMKENGRIKWGSTDLKRYLKGLGLHIRMIFSDPDKTPYVKRSVFVCDLTQVSIPELVEAGVLYPSDGAPVSAYRAFNSETWKYQGRGSSYLVIQKDTWDFLTAKGLQALGIDPSDIPSMGAPTKEEGKAAHVLDGYVTPENGEWPEAVTEYLIGLGFEKKGYAHAGTECYVMRQPSGMSKNEFIRNLVDSNVIQVTGSGNYAKIRAFTDGFKSKVYKSDFDEYLILYVDNWQTSSTAS